METKNNCKSTSLKGTCTFKDVKEIVKEAYDHELWTTLKAALAVIGSLSLAQRTSPLALILEGASGRGKSSVINMCEPVLGATKAVLCRVDNFTPKSFVSHSASVAREELDNIDLLPQLVDKTLLTKELAPLFRGSDADLRSNFAMLTAILDGKGHVSASGVHGIRGYTGRMVFNWIGGTTPVPARTDEIMGQMGNRLLRWEVSADQKSEDELLEFAMSSDSASEEDMCREAVNLFLMGHFERFPVNSVDPAGISISRELQLNIVRLAELLAWARVEVTRLTGTNGPEGEDFICGTAEGPQRIIRSFQMLARGLALIEQRTEVTLDDLQIVQHVALSSIPVHRRRVLTAVIAHGGTVYSPQAEKDLNVSRPTARLWMRELGATGIVQWKETNGNAGDSVVLQRRWGWLVANTEAEAWIEGEAADGQEPAEDAVAVPEEFVNNSGFHIQRAKGTHNEHHSDGTETPHSGS